MNKNKKTKNVEMNNSISYLQMNSGFDTSKVMDTKAKSKDEKINNTKSKINGNDSFS